MNKKNIVTIIESQRNYFKSGQTKDIKFRVESLKKLKRALVEFEEELLKALYTDMKKPVTEAYMSEVFLLSEGIKHSLKNIKKWTKPQKVKTPLFLFKGKSWIKAEPLGTALVISPWNYPLQLLLMPAIGAITAGNTVVLKPSEVAPATSKVISRMIKKYFDEKYIAVVEGGKKENQILLQEKFDYIFYTGSTAVGKIVMAEAAKNLTPITLELGGKSPTIVCKDANIKIAARRIAKGKFFNAGQTCIAPDYLLVDKSIKEKFIIEIKEELKNFYGENPEKSRDYGRIINENHFKRITTFLNQGEIIQGGEIKKKELYIAPTIMEKFQPEATIMEEEIFGPLLPIIEFEKIEDVINYINERPKPLALYLFTESKKTINRVLHETTSGGVCINDTLEHIATDYMPFGGVGNSGLGSYHGHKSFEIFSHYKSIMKKSTRVDIKQKYPPYKLKLKTIKMFFKNK